MSQRVREFLTKNAGGRTWPVITLDGKRTADRRTRGYYVAGSITVYVNQCLQPGQWPWSDPMKTLRTMTWPGWITDHTVEGVLMHELGHYFDMYDRPVPLSSSRPWHQLWRDERELTQYAKHDKAEDFAEAFRLFVTNPELLRELRPKRYSFFTDHGLQAIETRDWRTVLAERPDLIKFADESYP